MEIFWYILVIPFILAIGSAFYHDLKLNNLFSKKDDYLSDLRDKKDKYQIFFNKMEEIGNKDIWCQFVLNTVSFFKSEKNIENLQKEEDKFENVFEKAVQNDLNKIFLLVLYLQYAAADPLFDQGTKKSYWIQTALNRKSVDSFPHHNAIFSLLEKSGYIE